MLVLEKPNMEILMEILVKTQGRAKIARAMPGVLLFCVLQFYFAAAILSGLAQTPQALRSPEVHSDSRVTFRFRAPNALEVLLDREGARRVPMQKDQQGVWSIT